MPELNAFWAKYGCAKCEKYKLLVLEVDISDSKTAFVNNYVNKYNVKCPAVARGEGAEQLCNAVEHEGAGAAGPDYLIRTDKTYKLFPKNTDIDNAGGNVQHVCPVSLACPHQHPVGTPGITMRSLSAGNLAITVPKTGDYRISAYTADGRRIASARTRLEAGGNSFNAGKTFGSARVTVISIKGENNAVTRKVVWHN